MIDFELIPHPDYDGVPLRDLVGILPGFFSEDDPRSAAKQLDTAYAHGGGWRPMFKWSLNLNDLSITYPGDEPIHPYAKAQLRDEKLYLYPYSWLCIIQPDGSYEISRVD
jgi:hypothetical protein